MHTNRLAREKSPYLLQHEHNPVDWFPWGDEAFSRARAEDKPVFLSVGYSTCHWCHVMERESFENEAVAEILNRRFISIKVDREERPDIDRLYMLFVQATTGSGGWPMSVWLTPDREPFYGGTYFPPDSRCGRPGFSHILEQIAEAWRLRRADIITSGRQVLAELEKHSVVQSRSIDPGLEEAERCFLYLRRTFDSKLGGFGDAPKFPRPAVLDFLFRYFHVTGNQEARDMALLTLREMAKGGMNDQLGGGFHRYSVDDRWFVPHFEKMLYDQAQLATSYLEAFQITGETSYAAVARDIFEYVLRDMTHPEGGFYSAEDADSVIDPAKPHEKGEGAFYVWSSKELEDSLGAERAARFASFYGCEPGGNVSNDPHGEFSGKNILYQKCSIVPEDKDLAACRRILLEARSLRPRPHLDDKILTAWNGLMISALAKGAQVLEAADPKAASRYADAALRASRFILSRLYRPETGRLLRRWRDGEAAIDAFLDDYASLILALLDLYEATFDPAQIDTAESLAATACELFEDPENGGFFSTPASNSDLLLRLKDDYDGAERSGNSLIAHALLRLSALSSKPHPALSPLLRAFSTPLSNQSFTLPGMLCTVLANHTPASQVVIAGPLDHPATKALLAECRRRFRPFTTLFVLDEKNRHHLASRIPALASMTELDGKPAAYVCENFTCRLPVTKPSELAAMLT